MWTQKNGIKFWAIEKRVFCYDNLFTDVCTHGKFPKMPLIGAPKLGCGTGVDPVCSWMYISSCFLTIYSTAFKTLTTY